MTKPILYFLCTGNSCRSQMAEGWGKSLLGDTWDVYSAGIETHGVNLKAVKAMAEIGMDISTQTSDLIDMNLLNKATLVITLCGDALDNCPVIPSHIQHEHWGFDDPPKAEGTDAEKWAVFQRVRDEIGTKIQQFRDSSEA